MVDSHLYVMHLNEMFFGVENVLDAYSFLCNVMLFG